MHILLLKNLIVNDSCIKFKIFSIDRVIQISIDTSIISNINSKKLTNQFLYGGQGITVTTSTIFRDCCSLCSEICRACFSMLEESKHTWCLSRTSTSKM